MKLNAVMEYNAEGYLIYAADFIGAFVRGRTKEEALAKFPAEIRQYCAWLGKPAPCELAVQIVQQKESSGLAVCDADSDVLFDSEKPPLSLTEYESLKALVLKPRRIFCGFTAQSPKKTRPAVRPERRFMATSPSRRRKCTATQRA